MNKNKSVSVIVLTFNSEKYISRCLEALVAQLYRDFEILIVDAGSTDATLTLVDKYRNKLNIRVIDAPKTNMGQARNIGIVAAVGHYLCFCDSDDYYLPNKISIQYKFLQDYPEYSACYYDAYHFQSESPNQIYLVKKHSEKNGIILRDILLSQTININTLMINRKVLSENVLFPDDEAGKYAEDWQYLINLCLAGIRFGYISGSYSMIESRLDSHTSWDIQYLMKWYLLKHLHFNKERIIATGISELFFKKTFILNYIKFIFACAVSGNSKFCYRESLSGFLKSAILFQWLLKIACVLILEREYCRSFLRKIWLLKRRVNSRAVTM